MLRFSDLELDLGTREVHRGEAPIELTRTEFALLELFLRNPRQVLTRSIIFERVWGYDFGPTSNSLDVYIGYLRRKTEDGGALAADPHGPRCRDTRFARPERELQGTHRGGIGGCRRALDRRCVRARLPHRARAAPRARRRGARDARCTDLGATAGRDPRAGRTELSGRPPGVRRGEEATSSS